MTAKQDVMERAHEAAKQLRSIDCIHGQKCLAVRCALCVTDALLAFRKEGLEEILSPIIQLPRLVDAHSINIVVRRNGKDEVYEADWIKAIRERKEE